MNGARSMKNIDGRNISVIIVGFFTLKVAISDLKIPETHPEPPPPVTAVPQTSSSYVSVLYLEGFITSEKTCS